MRTVRRFLLALATGGLLGAVLFAWFSPVFIKWYGTPPVDLAINCQPSMEWAIDSYRKAIVVGLVVGAAFSSLLFAAFAGRGGKALAPPAAGGDLGEKRGLE